MGVDLQAIAGDGGFSSADPKQFKMPRLLLGLIASMSAMMASIVSQGDESILYGVLALCLFVIGTAWHACWNPLHPYVWFNGGFVLYSISSPILYLLNVYRPSFPFRDVLGLEYLAMVSFSVACYGARRVEAVTDLSLARCYMRGSRVVGGVSFLITLLYLYGYFISGVVTKTEKHLERHILLKLDFAYSILLVALLLWLAAKVVRGERIPVWQLLSVLGYYLFSFLVGGERAIVIRYVVAIGAMLLLLDVRVKRRYVILGALGVMAVGTLMGAAKNYLLLREFADWRPLGEARDSGIVSTVAVLVLGSEFRSASENLGFLLEALRERSDIMWNQTSVGELMTPFYPGFLLDREDIPSLSSWFTREFFPRTYETGGGVGFSLVAQGYLDFGWAGVVWLFLLVGLLIRLMYAVSGSSIAGRAAYAMFIPIALYSIRQSTAPLISQSLKHVLLTLILVWTCGKILSSVPVKRRRVLCRRREWWKRVMIMTPRGGTSKRE